MTEPDPPTTNLPAPTSTGLAVPDPAVAPHEDPAMLARRLTRLGLGALIASTGAARTALGTEPSSHRLGDIGLGALALAREASLTAGRMATDAAREAAAAMEPVVRQAGALPGVTPLVDAGRSGIESTLEALADAGRVERRLADTERSLVVQRSMDAVAGGDLLPDIIDSIATNPDLLIPVVAGVLDRLADDPSLVEPLVDGVMTQMAADPDKLLALVDKLLDPVVGEALPITLQQLTDDPTAIRSLIWDQSGGIATEMANSFRSRTLSADDAIDRVTARLRGGRRGTRRPKHDGTAPDEAANAATTGSGT